jgi:murein DD-endopeptidase MepM/ murein hydrolase activator NlpD
MGVTSTFMHLHRFHVEVGETVQAGTKIAEVGATGRVTGPHLDWRINWFQERLDPQLLLPASDRPEPRRIPLN